MTKVMFLCTGNSCRSQMAEGLARELGKDIIESYSAGLTPAGVNPRAVAVVKEIGIDISTQTSKAIDGKLLKQMDVIVTLCGHAEAMCPTAPLEIKKIHWPINDPVGAAGAEEEIMNAFRKARDEIKGNIRRLVNKLRDGDIR